MAIGVEGSKESQPSSWCLAKAISQWLQVVLIMGACLVWTGPPTPLALPVYSPALVHSHRTHGEKAGPALGPTVQGAWRADDSHCLAAQLPVADVGGGWQRRRVVTCVATITGLERNPGRFRQVPYPKGETRAWSTQRILAFANLPLT